MSRDWFMNWATNLKQQWTNETKSWPPGFYILAVRQQGGNQQTSSCNIISFKKTKEGNGIEQDEVRKALFEKVILSRDLNGVRLWL